MEDLVRERMHAALDVEPTPAYLRSRIMSSLPVAERSRRAPSPSLGWARTWVAALLVLAVVAGFAYVAHQIGNQTVHQPPPRPITPAQLWSPEGIAIAPDGTVYFSDEFSGYVFRRLPDGSLATVAGTRPAAPINQGDAGSGGPATHAYLFGPNGIAFDRAGNLYIADAYANRVRKIDGRGVIRTIAGTGLADGTQGSFAGDGGPAVAAHLSSPTAVAVDRQGAVYIADFSNRKVRLIVGGVISSLDDSTLPMAASLFHPHDLTLDAGGNLYVASGDTSVDPTGSGCEIVRRAPDGAWTRIAGTGICGFAGDGGPALDAQISSGGGMAFDAAGNLYFADTFNHRIRRIARDGTIMTMLVDDEFPLGLAISKDVLYVTEEADVSLTPSAPGRVRGFNLSNSYLVLRVDSHTPIHTSG